METELFPLRQNQYIYIHYYIRSSSQYNTERERLIKWKKKRNLIFILRWQSHIYSKNKKQNPRRMYEKPTRANKQI